MRSEESTGCGGPKLYPVDELCERTDQPNITHFDNSGRVVIRSSRYDLMSTLPDAVTRSIRYLQTGDDLAADSHSH